MGYTFPDPSSSSIIRGLLMWRGTWTLINRADATEECVFKKWAVNPLTFAAVYHVSHAQWTAAALSVKQALKWPCFNHHTASVHCALSISTSLQVSRFQPYCSHEPTAVWGGGIQLCLCARSTSIATCSHHHFSCVSWNNWILGK